jgi:hypothetical protein
VDELVHPAGPQRGPHRVRHRRARADVAQHLPAALRRVRPLLEEDDLRLLRKTRLPSQNHRSADAELPREAAARRIGVPWGRPCLPSSPTWLEAAVRRTRS